MTANRHVVSAEEVRSAKEALIRAGPLSAAGPAPGWLLAEIDRSWRRSISAGASRGSGDFLYRDEFDPDSELRRAARPVLDRLATTVHDLGTAIFLADASGQVIDRRIADPGDRERFDRAYAAEGFLFSETTIGTNGLGTPIEENTSVFVRGPEHFNEALEGLACAGVPIRHPITGRAMGSLSLAAPVDSAERMMLALTREGARAVSDQLTSGELIRDSALVGAYRRARGRGPVVVMDSETVISSVSGVAFLDAEAHARLWEALVAGVTDGRRLIELDFDGTPTRLIAHPLGARDRPAFAVEILDKGSPRLRGRPASPKEIATALPAADLAARPVLVTGPAGAGKCHAARRLLDRQGQPEPVVVFAAQLRTSGPELRVALSTLDAGRAVIVRRLEELPPAQRAVPGLLRDAVERTPGARLVATVDPDRSPDYLKNELARWGTPLTVPALSSRQNEIPTLAEAILGRLDAPRRPILSAATFQALLRWHWPGNVAELRRVLLDLADEFPGRTIDPFHLPETMWEAAERRRLSRIESVQRAEIVSALRESGGNRSAAATLLGIGRTTLYRKLRELGIDQDTLSA
ncbi:hypothetical protein G6031_14600 [Dietzia sp. CQ4]|uniref:helix-turn-helix domain-containing protein n=1 Tax=Dietzia sp. (strain CQ4) TaxID=370437 RepID=UPI0015FA1BC4|nr:hypothetical protein [Dietzia sp. CQ4]